jgi:hypothetical protein
LGSNISKESWRKIEQIQNNFITYNPKIKGNIHDHILLIEENFPLTPPKTTINTSGDGINIPTIG